jgi:tetratricopeptide (TPR) repeat protein
MPPSPAKSLSPAELSKLEQAFATDPSSDSYRPLAEAYLGLGRYMEAMVVCKKGVKAFPQAAEPRVLLARVYADQGKDRKALEELQAITVESAAALRLAGTLQLKLGEKDAGRASLLKAYGLDPSDPVTLEVLAREGLQAGGAPAPSAPTASAPAPAAAAAPASGPRPAYGAAPTVSGPVLSTPRPPPPPADASGGWPAVAAPSQPSPAARPPPAPPQSGVAPAPRRSATVTDWSPVSAVPEPERKARKSSPVAFLALLVVCVGGLGGYWLLGQKNAREKRELKKALDRSSEQLKHDSFDAYVTACKAAEEALDLRPDSGAAHGYLAYAWTVRWGEHGGGDEARKQAEEHLDAARRSGEESSYLYAAEALFLAWSGKMAEARSGVESRVKSFEDQGKASSTLFLTQGLIQMRAGDLVRARESLDRAQTLAPSDARVYAALANLYRRRGQDAQAAQNFASALRYERGHPESVLGAALLELDKDAPDFVRVGAVLKGFLEQEPPPSPRQLATAQLARALLISRVSSELSGLKADVAKALSEATGVSRDAEKAAAEVAKAEDAGFQADKANPELRLLKAKRLRSEKNVEAAVEELKQAISADPTRAQFYVELALALREKQGGEQEAVDALNEALKTMGESPRLEVMLGDALRRQGKLDEAIAQYEKALSSPTKNPDARLALGVAFRLKKDFPKAVETLDKAAQEFVGNSARVAESYSEMGRAHDAAEEIARAQDAFEKALNADMQYADGYFYFAKLLMKEKKMRPKARELFAKYLELEPKGRHAKDAEREVEKDRERESDKAR